MFTLDVVELKSSGLEKVGSWHQETGLNISRMSMPTVTDEGSLSNRSFIVITALVTKPNSAYIVLCNIHLIRYSL